MRSFSSAAVVIAALCTSTVNAFDAGPNTLAFYQNTLRTASYNITTFIVPVSTSSLQAAVPYPLIASCATNKSLFPKGLPANTFPLLVTSGYQFDIRMLTFEIDSLTGSSIYAPCVDRLGDGKTPFLYPISTFVGGADGQALPAYVPSFVGSLESVTITPGHLLPNDLAYRRISNGYFTSLTKALIVPNPVSGPGVIPAAIDMLFTTATPAQSLPAHTYHYLNNLPVISSLTTQCFRQNYYFNETFAAPVNRVGTVTLYEIDGVQTGNIAGRYTNVEGLSANVETIGYALQSCSQAAAQNDPFALQ